MALATASLNLGYVIVILWQFLKFSQGEAFQAVAISAIAASFGVMAILVWVALDPIARRSALLLMVVPLLIGNWLHTLNLHITQSPSLLELGNNLIFGILYATAHVAAYWLAGRGRADAYQCHR